MAYYPKDGGRDITGFDAVQLKIADEQTILNWSHGEVLKSETINYRTQKPERDGLFCEKIFGPIKDINPNDSKHRGIRSREAAVDKNGELVTKASARRERMGHIKLANPVAHIWFMHDSSASPMKDLLGMTVRQIERVVYYASYIILSVDTEKVEQLSADNEAMFDAGKTAIKIRYDKASEDENADLPKLADAMTKELDELTEKYEETKMILGGFHKKALITENEYNNLPEEYEDLIEVSMGGEAIAKLLGEIDLDELMKEVAQEVESRKGQARLKVQKRLKTLEGIKASGIVPKDLTLTVLPVIPPDLRPMVQLSGDRFATSDLNDLYRRVINRNNRLKKLTELHAPEVIQRNEKRMLQEAVDALFDNSMTHGNRKAKSTNNKRDLKSLADLLRGKQGRFRQNLLGKRVDYSGRSVIVPGPELKIDQCGLPKKMALELFRPFVINKLLEWDQAHNIKAAQRLIDATETVVWDALDEVIEGKYVLLNRAPTLHRLGIQAFKPKLIGGSAIQLHPLVTTGFNADFDGDQMAVHLPLSAEAQAEARDLMSATNNLLKPSDGAPVLSIYQDIILGAYYLTYAKPSAQTDKIRVYANIEEAILAKDKGVIEYQTPITVPYKGEIHETTLGRLLVNEVLPEDFPFINEPLSKKPLNKVMAQVFNQYGSDVTAQIADAIKELTLEHATRSAVSTGMYDYFDIEGLDRIMKEGELRAAKIDEQAEMGLMTENERYRRTVETWIKVDDDVKDLLQEQLTKSDTAISVLTNSGARGSLSNIKWATGMIGVTVDSYGHESELPVKSSFKKGLTPLEQFLYTRSTRKGSIDTALKTANSGYLTRRLVDVAQDVFTVDDERGDDPGYTIYRSETKENLIEFGDRLYGRYTSEHVYGADGKEIIGDHDLITRSIADQIQNDESIEEVKIMSILSTKQLKGIPQRSYGIDMATGYLVAEHEPVGVIAAQSVGEPGTQLTLNTFHLGGEAGGAGDITQGLPRVEELLEARKPKGEAIISDIAGKISLTEDKKAERFTIKVTPAKAVEERVKIDKYDVKVENGAEVRVGDVLAEAEGKAPIVSPMDAKIKVLTHDIVLKPLDLGSSKEYQIPAFKMLKDKSGDLILHDGDEVVAGDRLSAGSIDPHKLMEYKGVEAAQRYIINDILRIYAAQGQNIADKHLEIIVRQMFSRVQIEDAGDSSMVVGDIVPRAQVEAENSELLENGKEPARYSQLLTGIINVGKSSESFLSAASFLDTTRILIKAASSGKIDHLRGLKENVIIGRKIPVGTGALDEEEFYLGQTEGDSIDEIAGS